MIEPLPGAKSLVWISGGVPVVNCNGSYESTSRAVASQFGRQMITTSIVNVGTRLGTGSLGSFEDLTQFTGGKIYSNDIETAIPEIMAASHSTYLLEYDAPRNDGKYHKIRVTTTRKDIRLQFKQAYEAN